MNDRAAARHAFTCQLREVVNKAAMVHPQGHGLTGDEVFAGIMFVLVENIAKTRQPIRDALVNTVILNIEAAVNFEATGKDFPNSELIPPGARRQ